jgi:hypothetical protein
MCYFILDLEVVAMLPSAALQPLHQVLVTTNLHPVKLLNYYANNLVLCQHHTRVSNTLEDMCAKKAKESNDMMSLKIHYVLFMLTAFIKEGVAPFLSRFFLCTIMYTLVYPCFVCSFILHVQILMHFHVDI